MKKPFISLFVVILCMIILVGCNSGIVPSTSKEEIDQTDQTDQTSLESKTNNSKIKVGEYVQFGSYLEEPILWRVMEINDGKPLLWSEFILTAKCFDASESVTASLGEDNAQKYGSNVWSNSNIREWLNTVGTVNWSTQPPTEAAMWGNNGYENETGFLSEFTSEERSVIAITIRKVLDSNDELMETTQDTVFLASYEEVRDSGKWGLNQKSREKTPTDKAMQNNQNEYPDIRLASSYYLAAQGVDNCAYQVYGVFDDGRIWVGDPNDSYYGVAPALCLSSAAPKGGNGTKDNPWKY